MRIDTRWRKSTYSGAGANDCVEVNYGHDHAGDPRQQSSST
jgi:hypothetical protein